MNRLDDEARQRGATNEDKRVDVVADGRYDTPAHPLFRTLKGEHADDFYQPCENGRVNVNNGPRLPWQDVHARVVGPAARDIMVNFVERSGGRKKASIYDALRPLKG